MPRGNRDFAVKSMQKAFIRRLEKAGIDPQLVDINKYDWDSFNHIDDLIEHYANHGDIICRRLYERENYDQFIHQYLNQSQVELPEEVIEAVLKHVREELADINVKYLTLESHINDIRNKLSAVQATAQASEPASNTIKLDLDKTFQDLKNELITLRERIRELEDQIHKPTAQATLTRFSDGDGQEGVEKLIEIMPEHKTTNMSNNSKRNNKRKGSGFSFGHFALVNIMGFILSLIASDILNVNMFFFYLVFMAIAFIDGLVWGGAWGSRGRKTTKAFATGYMYSQYTNPYKMGRGG